MVHNDQLALTDVDVHFLDSEHVGDEFKILVARCGPESAPPSVLFLSDPNILFGTTVEMIRLQSFFEELPPALVVGVGYRTTDSEVVIGLRMRDFSPSLDTSDPADDPNLMGGAEKFLAFVRHELKPWLKDRYGVDPDDSTFFGDSLGGLFATYVLLTEPGTFRRYGIGSPSLWWDKKMIFGLEAEYADRHDDLDARVFFSIGAEETPEGSRRLREQLRGKAREKAEDLEVADPALDMVADTDEMVALLRGHAYPGLELDFQVLPGESHLTALPVNLSRSLRYLFDVPR